MKKIKKKKLAKAKQYVDNQMASMLVAKEKAAELSQEKKDEVKDIILKEITVVASNRLRFMEEVLGRNDQIKTTMDMGDGRTLTLELK